MSEPVIDRACGDPVSTEQILATRPDLRRLLRLIRRRGKCVTATDWDAWYRPASKSLGNARARAANLCHGCPVLSQCREYALQAWEEYGIWGGLCEFDRARRSPVQTYRTRDMLKRRSVQLVSDLPDGT
jgi:hypothetical protein